MAVSTLRSNACSTGNDVLMLCKSFDQKDLPFTCGSGVFGVRAGQAVERVPVPFKETRLKVGSLWQSLQLCGCIALIVCGLVGLVSVPCRGSDMCLCCCFQTKWGIQGGSLHCE